MSQPDSIHSTQTFTNSKISRFEVQLSGGHDTNSNIYFTGGKLSGLVYIDVKYPVKALIFVNNGSETRSKALRRGNRRRLVLSGWLSHRLALKLYTQTGIVFKWVQISKLGNMTKRQEERAVIFGKEKTKTSQKLPVGEHRFPVSLDLPENLLPSTKCNSHFVRYYCQANIIRRFKKRSPWSTGKQEFLVYQDNSDARTNLVPSQQTPVDFEEILKPLRLSYQLHKTGYYLGETPTIVGEIYNSGKSTVCLKIGIDIVQTTKVSGEVNLLVTRLKANSKKDHEGFGPWSRQLRIYPMTTESFSAEMNLKSLPPTTHSLEVDITYQVVLKVSVERNMSFLKPKQEAFSHDIVIARGSRAFRREASKVSIGAGSVKRKTPTPRPRAEPVFRRESPPPQFALAMQDLPSTSKRQTPPPPYGRY